MTSPSAGYSLSYVLITSARNVAGVIENTLTSVVRQTVLPQTWIIVNDGSTDGTDSIVRHYVELFPWIQLLEMPRHDGYDFSAKARCFNAAFARLRGFPFDIVANVDADVSFEADYFDFLLKKFIERPRLGVAGTPMKEGAFDVVEDALFNQNDVFGACQVFRRECLEEIGGYLEIKRGIDCAAVRMARMKGWETRSFLEKRFIHHRVMSTTECSLWRAFVNHGREDYVLGNHPLWEGLRVLYQMTRRPRVVRGLLMFAGYASAWLQKTEHAIPPDLVRFHRGEQVRRLRGMVSASSVPVFGRRLTRG
jgi:poly-beta-1,6-N-acetyl-D-glucosamine synthase